MSDQSGQSLREALQELRLYCGKYVDDPDASEDEQIAYDDVCIHLAQILAKHPAEPAPVRQADCTSTLQLDWDETYTCSRPAGHEPPHRDALGSMSWTGPGNGTAPDAAVEA